jgi:hypothetical protein
MSKWIYPVDELDETGAPFNGITNDLLFEWLKKYLDPKEWFIEITGGEPGLYPEIGTLITGLVRAGYKGLVRTNGSQPIPGLPSFQRLSAWHKGHDFPEFYDHILILENETDDWESKVAHCEENNIPYTVLPYRHYSDPNRPKEETSRREFGKLFTDMTTMFASGRMTGCFSGSVDLENGGTLQKMSEPEIVQPCMGCVNIAGLEKFVLGKFKDVYGITDDMLHGQPVYYPMLNAKSEWVSKEGNVVGVLGDDISAMPQERVFL